MLTDLRLHIKLELYLWNKHVENKAKTRWYYNYLPAHVVKAFTLAEVLITLLIIGVVASITIPGLIADMQEQEFKVAWKKSYGIAAQAYANAIRENGGIGFGNYGGTPFNGNNKFDALKAQLSVLKECNGNTYGNCWSSNGVGPDSLNIAYCFEPDQNANRAFMTSDGDSWLLCDNAYAIIAVDVNGLKGPNRWGKDVFQFKIKDHSIVPSTEEITYNSIKYLYQY